MSLETVKVIDPLLPRLTADEKLHLISRLAESIRSTQQPRKLVNLRGVWADKVPADFPLDSALKDIRGQWEEDVRDMSRE